MKRLTYRSPNQDRRGRKLISASFKPYKNQLTLIYEDSAPELYRLSRPKAEEW